jgi:hypothetical protein
VNEPNDHPLDLQQLARMNRDDIAQLRARCHSRRVCTHPETKAVILALLDHIDPSTAPELSRQTKEAYQAWQDYYDRPRETRIGPAS